VRIAAAAVRWLFCLPEPGDLRAGLAGAGSNATRCGRLARPSGSAAEILRGSPAPVPFFADLMPARPDDPARAASMRSRIKILNGRW
jgi:hypothetical protein